MAASPVNSEKEERWWFNAKVSEPWLLQSCINKLFHSINMWLKNLKIFDCKFGLNVLSAELIPINVRNNLERSTTFYTKDALWHYTGSNEVFVPAICEILANFLFAYFFLTAISFPFSLALDVFTSNVAKSMMFSLIDSSG